MPHKLQAIIVDDEQHIINIIQALCKDSQYVEIIKTFTNPVDFLNEAPKLDFDLALLDMQMPEMEGTVVAQMLKNKAFMFITGAKEKLYEVLGLSPIDVVTKPIMKDRLESAMAKAHKLLKDTKEFGAFSIAESKHKVKLRLPDIMLAVTDEDDPRHKMVYMRDGETYTLMDTTLETLTEMCPALHQVSKREAVSMDIVNEIEHDMVTLKKLAAPNAPKYVTLGRAFSKTFKEKLFYK
jgi:DNA-binding LytR/AlgR family response regulator